MHTWRFVRSSDIGSETLENSVEYRGGGGVIIVVVSGQVDV